MIRIIDIVLSPQTMLTEPLVVGTTRDAIILQTDPKRTVSKPRKIALDVRTGEVLAHLPEGYATPQAPSPTLDGGVEIRVVKRPRDPGTKSKAIKDVELCGGSGERFVLASRDDAIGFVAGRVGGALYTDPLAPNPNLHHTPQRDTRRLVLTLARANGPVVTLRLPWWVAALGIEVRRLGNFRTVVCMRARVLIILGPSAYWFSLDALEVLLEGATDGAPIAVRGIINGDSKANLPTLDTKLTVLAQKPVDDPILVLAQLLGWGRDEATREGQALVLTQRAAEQLERALR